MEKAEREAMLPEAKRAVDMLRIWMRWVVVVGEDMVVGSAGMGLD